MDLATIGFAADTSGLMKAEKGLDNLSKQGAKTDKAMSGAGASIGKSFAGIAAAVGGLVSATSAMQKLIATSREFDVLNAGLITATGSAENASAAFKAIEDFATTTPYSLGQATKAFTQLVNLGLTPSEKALTSYGNTAAAMGKDLSQMVEAVADATVGEFERLKEFGIKSRVEGDNVSFTFRGMTTTVKKSAEEIEGYLIGLGQNEFASAMANRMNTLDGAISNLSDSWDGLFRTISSQGAGDLITSGVRMATDAISELTDMIASGQLGAYIDAIGDKFKGWGADIAVVLDAIGQLFADAGEYWYLDMSESSRLIIDAFKNIPENIRAFIQIATVELSAFVDGVAVYAKAIGSYLNITEESVNISAEFERISAAREASLSSIMGERDAALQSFESQITAADGLREKYDQLSSSTGTATDRLAQYKVQAVQSASATSGLTKELTKLDDAMGDHFDALEELDQIEKDRIARKEQEIDAMLEPFEEGTKAVKEYATISEKAAERVESAFADAWLNAFDGFESVVDGMKNAFKRMLAEMAHMALTKPIMISLGMGGLLPGAASAATGAGGLGSAAGGLGLLGGIGGSITGLGGMIGGSFGGGLAGAGGLVSAGNFGGLISGAGSLFGSGNIAAGIGMSLPLIAAGGAIIAAGSQISKALGGTGNLLRGGIVGDVLLGSWKNESQSLDLSLAGGDVTGTETSTDVKKKLFKNRRRSSTTAFDTSAIDDAFDEITMAIGAAANTFGIVGADEIIKGFTASANINIKDKSQAEIEAAIQEWIGNTSDALVGAVFGDSLAGLQKEGEGVIDTVNRLSMNMSAVQSISKTLGLGFDLTGKEAMIASTNIVELAGGIYQLSALTGQYYASFYTEAEQQQNLATQLADAFGKINVTMPTTREGFRAIIDGLDLTTESGQEMFAALMQLVPGMSQYLDALEAQRAASEQAAEAALKEAEAKAAALKAQGLDLQLRLYDALGQSSEALALRRQMELEATDETLRSILLQIYAAEDASAAQRELASAQAEAARLADEAAREAIRAAEEAMENARRIAEQRQSLEVQLLEALGRKSEATAMQRQIELAAMDESLRGLQLSIWAAYDAAEAQEALAQAQEEAAFAALEAERAMKDLAQSAFGKLQQAADAEKQLLQSGLDERLKSLQLERDTIENNRATAIAGYESQGQAINDYISKLQGVKDAVGSFVSETGSAINPFKRLGQIFNEFRGGLAPNSSELSSVLGAIQSAGSSGFGSATEQERAMAIARNQALSISGLAGGEISGAKSQLQLIETQIADANKYYDAELLKLDQAAELAQKLHDEQVALIDKQVAEAQKQLNALLGVDDRILSMSEALNEFYAAMNSASSVQVTSAQEQVTSAQEQVTSAQEQVIAAYEITNKIEEIGLTQVEAQLEQIQATHDVVAAVTEVAEVISSGYWAGRAEMARPDVPMNTDAVGEPVNEEVVVLLKELIATAKANAEHASKSASMLQEMTVGGLDVRVEA